MEESYIEIINAKVHNLKGVSLKIPRYKITCFAGPSGSGKSSLAFHTLYTESKRRFLNSFPNYLKFFADKPAPVEVDEIRPVLPTFALKQINPILSARSYALDTAALTPVIEQLFFNHSRQYCPTHRVPLEKVGLGDLLKPLLAKQDGIAHLFVDKSQYHLYSSILPARSYHSGGVHEFDRDDMWWELTRVKGHMHDRIDQLEKDLQRARIDRIALCFEGSSEIQTIDLVQDLTCPHCDYIGYARAYPEYFSPHSPLGVCKRCNGFGATLEVAESKVIKDENLSIEDGASKFLHYKIFSHDYKVLVSEAKKRGISLTKPYKKYSKVEIDFIWKGAGKYCGILGLAQYLEETKYKTAHRIYLRMVQEERQCPDCLGTRIATQVQYTAIPFEQKEMFYKNFLSLSFSAALQWVQQLRTNSELALNNSHLEKLYKMLQVGVDLGLGHLNFMRRTKTLSAGEYQRCLLIKFLAYQGADSLFILDEPSLGLDENEITKLMAGLKQLQQQGNTVIVIDHQQCILNQCDWMVRMGPGAGHLGGEIIYQGLPDLEKFQSEELSQHAKALVPTDKWLQVKSPTCFDYKFKDFTLALERVNWVKGASGSGKTSALIHCLSNQLCVDLGLDLVSDHLGQVEKIVMPSKYKFQQIIVIDSQLNRYSSRSTVGSLSDLVTPLRKHFALLPISKSMGLQDSHFSVNSELGQCQACQGAGIKVIEMNYMDDVVLPCDVCEGKRLKPIYAEISDGRYYAYQALSAPIKEVFSLMRLTPKYERILNFFHKLNLGHLSLERKVSSLSGGERQRLYLLSCLLKEIHYSLVIFENISFGLSASEFSELMLFLSQLTSDSNTLVFIDQSKQIEFSAHHTLNF